MTDLTSAAAPPLAPPRRRAPAVRPEQILDAAERVLLDKGLAATTMDDIAMASGLAKGTMYLYFKSKTQVLAALRIRQVERMLVVCSAAARRGRTASAVARVERFLEALYDATVADGALLRILFREAGMEDENEMALVRDELLTYVEDGRRAGELTLRDPEMIIAFLVYGIHGLFEANLAGGSPDRRRVVSATRRVVRALLQPAAVA